MTTLLVADPKIAARLPPFRSVRRDAAAAAARMREEVRELVPQSAIHLIIAVLAQERVERDQVAVVIRATGSGPQSRAPDYGDERHDLQRTD